VCKKFAFLTLACAIFVAAPRHAAADPVVLASANLIGHLQVTPVYFTFAMGWGNWLFEEHPITGANVGSTFVANAGNDPQFAEIARKLTNGLPSYAEYLVGVAPRSGGGIGYGSEAALFQLGPKAIDFRGATITALTLRVVSFGPSAQFPGWTELGTRLSVLGEGTFDPAPVPEPATLTLLATGAFGVYSAARRRRKTAAEAEARARAGTGRAR
jgi:hypothetical protein